VRIATKGRSAKSEYTLLRERIQAGLSSGELKESDDLSCALKVLHFDSLETVELIMSFEEFEERGIEIEPLRDVRDLLRLLKTLEFQEWRRNKHDD